MAHDAIDPELPWGCWFELRRTGNGTVVVDEQGREFESVRDAFWRSRLRMVAGAAVRDGILELLHAVLTRYARAARTNDDRHADTRDLFWHGGKFDIADYSHMFHAWLAAEGILDGPPAGHVSNVLTDEGWSVLMMLDATRPDAVRAMRPGTPSLATLTALARPADEDREEWRRRVEELSSNWPAYFQRRTIAQRPIVELVRVFDNGTPRKRTVWTMRFHSEEGRDAFFDWLADRVDRWQKFGSLAFEEGGMGLSHHILELMSTEPCRSGGQAGASSTASGANFLALTDQR